MRFVTKCPGLKGRWPRNTVALKQGFYCNRNHDQMTAPFSKFQNKRFKNRITRKMPRPAFIIFIDNLYLVAHLHCRTQTRIPTPNPMATLYCTELFSLHRLRLEFQSRSPILTIPILGRISVARLRSESIFGNVNKPLHHQLLSNLFMLL